VPVAVKPDPRVIALVLLAPAASWFRAPDSLSNVHVPILMLGAELDMFTPPDQQTALIKARLPASTRLTFREVPNAGHYSILSPYEESVKASGFPPAQDPPGFDRRRFHEILNADLVDFLQKRLKPSGYL
jgi:predicted dienelactone hydrolase